MALLATWRPLLGVDVWKLGPAVCWFNPGQTGAQYRVGLLNVGS